MHAHGTATQVGSTVTRNLLSISPAANHDPLARIDALLRPSGIRLRLGTGRTRPVALRGSELRVHPLLFAAEDAVPLLVRYATSGGCDARRELQRLGAVVVAAVDSLDQAPARCFLPVLGPLARERLVWLDDELARRGIRLHLNDNRRLLLTLRRERQGGFALGIHHGLLAWPETERELLRYALRSGRGRYPLLDRAMGECFGLICERLDPPAPAMDVDHVGSDPEPSLPSIGTGFDLDQLAASVHRRWFADLAPIPVCWGRDPGRTRHLRSIHFGTFRSRPRPQIRLHPRLAQAWVAHCFVEHVLHHEYCHWRQHCLPERGERPHSARFKLWEAEYPHYAAALAWQRNQLGRILAPVA